MTLDPHLDGYEQDIEPGAGLGVGPGGDKVVLHTTETGPGSFDAVRNMWRGAANWGKGLPHFLMEGRRIVQLLPLTANAYTMENAPGGADTNRSGHVIQIEIVHRSGQPLSDEQYDVLGKWLADLKKAGLDFDLENHPEFYGAGCGWILAAYDAKQRFSAAKWTAGRFWAGHQHALENAHWDPGPIDGDRLEAIARSYLDGAPAPELPLEEDDPMFCVLKNRDTGEHFVWAVGAARPQKVGAVVAQNLCNTGKALLGNGAPFEVDGAFLASIETPIGVTVQVINNDSAKQTADELARRLAS